MANPSQSTAELPWQSRIGNIRKDKGVSQRELAEAVGVSENTISSWDRTIPASFDIAFKICRFFSAEIETEFQGDDILALRNIAILRQHYKELDGISQRQLAHAIQVTENTIGTWEKENHQTVEKLEKLRQKLGFTRLSELYRIPQAEEPSPIPPVEIETSRGGLPGSDLPNSITVAPQSSGESTPALPSHEPPSAVSTEPQQISQSRPDPLGLYATPDIPERYALLDMVGVSLCASLCGAKDWDEVEQYGKRHRAMLEEFLPLLNGIPSLEAMQQFLSGLKSDVLRSHLVRWIEAIAALEQASPGRGLTGDRQNAAQKFTYDIAPLLSIDVWTSPRRLIMSGAKDITHFEDWLQLFELSDNIALLDAPACQPSIAQSIIKYGGNYILRLKSLNQTEYDFYQNVETYIAAVQELQKKHQRSPVMPHQFLQKQARRSNELPERQRYWLVEGVAEELIYLQEWLGLQRIAMAQWQRRLINGQPIEPREGYYLLSLDEGITDFENAIAAYWDLEIPEESWVLQVQSGPTTYVQPEKGWANLKALEKQTFELSKQPQPPTSELQAICQDRERQRRYLSNILSQTWPISILEPHPAT